MTYKSDGYGLKIYDIFQKGYTYQIFMCNNPVSKKYLSKRLSPLGARGMELLDNVEGLFHQCAMYNLYNSSTFFKAAYNH